MLETNQFSITQQGSSINLNYAEMQVDSQMNSSAQFIPSLH